MKTDSYHLRMTIKEKTAMISINLKYETKVEFKLKDRILGKVECPCRESKI